MNYLQFHLLFKDLDFAFVHIAKNASTNIKRAALEKLSRSHGYDLPDFSLYPNIVHTTAAQFAIKDICEIKNRNVVAIIRDPLERIVSAFANKYIQKSSLSYTVDFAGYSSSEEMNENFTFDTFCNLILDSDPKKLNGHWAPQSINLIKEQSYKVFDFNKITNSPEFKKETGLDLFDKTSDSGTSNSVNYYDYNEFLGDKTLSTLKGLYLETGAVPLASNLLSNGLIQKLSEYYAEDFGLYQKFNGADYFLI